MARKKWLKKLGKGALAVSTGGASLAFKKARPNYVAPAQRNTASKPIAQISARQPQPAQRPAMRAVRPTSAKPFNPAQRNAMRAVRPASAQPFNPAQRGAMRAVRPASAQPFNPAQRPAMRAVRPASAQPFNPARQGKIVGYNAESKEVIRSNQQGGSTPRISIVINNNNNTPTNPIKKVVDKKTGKPLVAQRAK